MQAIPGKVSAGDAAHGGAAALEGREPTGDGHRMHSTKFPGHTEPFLAFRKSEKVTSTSAPRVESRRLMVNWKRFVNELSLSIQAMICRSMKWERDDLRTFSFTFHLPRD
jgi:hypothetical protein